MRALVDADSIVFNCGFAVEHSNYLVYAGGDYETPITVCSSKKELKEFESPEFSWETVKEVEPLENCLYLVKQKMEFILRNTEATSYSVYIKGKGNFREEVAVTRPYKGNRDKNHRPVYEEDIRKYLKDKWGAEEVDGMEVDDKVAIEQTKFWEGTVCGYRIDGNSRKPNDPVTYRQGQSFVGYTSGTIDENKNLFESIICTPDKDLNQIPGWHYDYNKQEKFWVTEEEALHNLYMQILTGDASDNIQGIPKIGPAKADVFLAGCKTEQDYYKATRVCYEAYYKEKAEEVLKEMATLVYIKRTEEDMWKPPL